MLFMTILGSFEHSQKTQKDKQKPASGLDIWLNVLA
jgi:hypothetical protein